MSAKSLITNIVLHLLGLQVLLHAGPADLDTSFNSTGKVLSTISGKDIGYGIAAQPDGKVVVAGSSSSSGGFSSRFGVLRYNSNGSLDLSFGSGGKLTTSFGGDAEGRGVVLQPDGKIVVAGFAATDGFDYDFAVARYTSSGALDTSFGSGGKVTTDFGRNFDYGLCVVLQTDGKIIVAGQVDDGSGIRFGMVRYTTNGSLDTSFGSNGKVLTSVGSGNAVAHAICLQSDGKIVLAGEADDGVSDFALVRYDPNGNRDTSFGSSGRVIVSIRSNDDVAYGVAQQPDGKLVVVGSTGFTTIGGTDDFALVRLTTDGDLDETFNADGILVSNLGDHDTARSVWIRGDGKILVGGWSYDGDMDFVVARYNPSGSADTSFSPSGKGTTRFGSSNGECLCMAVQTDGRILLGGYIGPLASEIAVARFVGEPTEPEINVFTDSGHSLVDATSVINFGDVITGESAYRNFRIRNTGSANLTGLQITFDGSNEDEFEVVTSPVAPLAPGASTSFTIKFTPSGMGQRAAELHIANNDRNENPFDLDLLGRGVASKVGLKRGTLDLANGATTSFGDVVIGKSKTVTFSITNTGTGPLEMSSVTFDGPPEFRFGSFPSTRVAPGGTTSFTLLFEPTTTGSLSGLLEITSNDDTNSVYQVTVDANGFASPSISGSPTSVLKQTGSSHTFSVAATGSGTLDFLWLKNGVPITGGPRTAQLPLTAITIKDAGMYSCKVTNAGGSVTTSPFRLAVVDASPRSVTFNQDSTITLSVAKSIPAGTVPSYVWHRLSGSVQDGGTAPAQVVTGASASTLKITKAAAANADAYGCTVTLDGMSVESGVITVSVLLRPQIAPAGPFQWFVSGGVADTINASNGATKFVFEHLPSGLVGNQKTGAVTGIPNRPSNGVKTFTVKAWNPAGYSVTSVVSYTVEALPAAAIGVFSGLLGRNQTLSGPLPSSTLQGLGGKLSNLVITSTGAFTGKIFLEDRNYSMPAQSRLRAAAGGNPTGSVTIVRGSQSDAIPDLVFDFVINKNSGELTGTVSDGAPGNSVAVNGWRNPWHSSNNPAAAANYNAALILDSALAGTDPGTVPPGNTANAIYPQGTGFGQLTLQTNGNVTWNGTLADGTKVTWSTTMGPLGHVPCHVMLYTPTNAATAGSLQGWMVSSGSNVDSVPPLDWVKKQQGAASTTRGYRAGFPLHQLTVVGSVYRATDSPFIVLGLSDSPENAEIAFVEGGIRGSALGASGELLQRFTVSTTNKVTMLSGASANPSFLQVTEFDAKTGNMAGTFKLVDPDPRDTTPPIKNVERIGTWFGLLVPRLGQGVGNFQLSALPVSSAAPPMLSGDIAVGATD